MPRISETVCSYAPGNVTTARAAIEAAGFGRLLGARDQREVEQAHQDQEQEERDEAGRPPDELADVRARRAS